MKATGIANANTAIIKYWGKFDDKLKLPMNSSMSMTTDIMETITTVEFREDLVDDDVMIDKKPAGEKPKKRVSKQLDVIRTKAGITTKAKVISENNFPSDVGLASSASAFAALTIAGCAAAGLELDQKELSIISRQGSGSSCRSIYGGFVKWIAAEKNEDSYAVQVASEDELDLRDVTVIVTDRERPLGATDGMKLSVQTCPIYNARLEVAKKNIEEMEAAIKGKDFTTIGKTMEFDTLLMHAITITTKPALIYWAPETVMMMDKVAEWRKEGLEAYYSIETGANLHLLTTPENVEELEKRVKELPFVKKVYSSKPGKGARLTEDHLF
jgi:diphosphomevalonate decarboxylase